MPATPPADQFVGAQDDINKQRTDALNALAQFGRRGLDAAVARRQQTEGAQQGLVQQAQAAGGTFDPYGNKNQQAAVGQALAGSARQALNPFVGLSQGTEAMVGRENQAQQQVEGNYFNQAAQAVPLYQQNAQDIVSQYKAAYDERQAQQAHQLAMEAEQRQQAAAQLSAIQAQANAQAPSAPTPGAAPAPGNLASIGGGSLGSVGAVPSQDNLMQEYTNYAGSHNPLQVAAFIASRPDIVAALNAKNGPVQNGSY